MLKLLKQDRSFYKRLAALSVPMIVQNLISSSSGMVDTFMVGMLGQDSLSGVSLANIPFFAAMLFVFGLQSGGAILISQYWGKNDKSTINRVLGISWYLGCAASLLFATIIFIFPNQIMSLTTNDVALQGIAARYGRTVAYAYAINSFVMVFTGALRACERPLLGTFIAVAGLVTNVFFNWVLIFGNLGVPAMGVEGAALATVIARAVEMCIVIGYIVFFKNKPFKLEPLRIFRPGAVIFRDYLKYSAPVMLNETFWGFGASIYPVIFGHMIAASDIVAAYALSGNIERIVTVAVFAMAHTSAIFIGTAIGSGNTREQVLSLGKTISLISTLIGLFSGAVLTILLFTFIKPVIFPLFTLTENAQRTVIIFLVVTSCMMIFRAFNTTLIVGILRGGGDVKFGMYLDIAAMYLWAIPLGAVAGLVLKLDILWVFMFIVSEEFIKSAVGYMRFRKGLWVKNVTREMA